MALWCLLLRMLIFCEQSCGSATAQVPDYKIICFFVTARATQLFSELFNALGIEARPALPACLMVFTAF